MNEDWVSVIVTSYNEGAYLEEAVQSVKAQTYQHTELIIVDDGSDEDKTLALLKTYKEQGEKIIRISNSGVSVARNTGAKEASGKYVIFLDGDDRIEPSYVETVMRVQRSCPDAGMVFTLTMLFGQKNYVRPLDMPSYEKLLVYNDYFVVTCLLSREHFLDVGGFDPKMIYGIEDWEFFLRYCHEGMHVCRVNKPLFQYRIKKKSRTKDVNASIRNTLSMRLRMLSNNLDAYAAHPAALRRYRIMPTQTKTSLWRIIQKLTFVGREYLAMWMRPDTTDIFTL